MDDARFARLVRVLRHRRRWRQVDLAGRASVTRAAISRVECGRACELHLDSLRAIVAALGASLELSVGGVGTEVDRVLDERHARLLGAMASWLGGFAWTVQTEVSYSEWGERGSIDLLAFGAAGVLLVVEVKSELVSIEATLRKHDEKARLAPVVAARRLGWQPTRDVARVLVLPDDRTVRRRVLAHADVLGLAYPAGTRAVRAWCRSPRPGGFAGLMFLTPVSPSSTTVTRGRRQRIRTPRGEPTWPGLSVG